MYGTGGTNLSAAAESPLVGAGVGVAFVVDVVFDLVIPVHSEGWKVVSLGFRASTLQHLRASILLTSDDSYLLLESSSCVLSAIAPGSYNS